MDKYISIHKSLIDRLLQEEIKRKAAEEMIKEIKTSISELQKEFVNENT